MQLYTVREQAAADLPGTLAAIAKMGYREVELAGLHGRTAAEVATLLREHGLSAPAAHYGLFELLNGLDEKLADLDTLGVRYLVCSFPWAPDPARLRDRPGGPGAAIFRGELTLDEWRWNAEQIERIGEAAAGAGLRFAYHNHAMEFVDYDGTVAYDELLRLTDPERVSFEVDCAWVAAAGRDPAEQIRGMRTRARLLHVKDVDPNANEFVTVPVGKGNIDWKAVFAAVDPARLDHYFVEQEHFTTATPLQAVAESIDYLEQLGRG
ncbi:MAG TPA: sugar phosphate isomerase/epimerase [Pseudomonadales bacterium]